MIFTTVNPSLPEEMDFLIHHCGRVYEKENGCTPLKRERYWEINPRHPWVFPQNFPREISWAFGIDTSLVLVKHRYNEQNKCGEGQMKVKNFPFHGRLILDTTNKKWQVLTCFYKRVEQWSTEIFVHSAGEDFARAKLPTSWNIPISLEKDSGHIVVETDNCIY